MEQILESVAQAKSPVSGESWPALDKEYRKKKIADGFSGRPNLETSGDMLDSLTFKNTEDGIEIGIFGSEAWKADGHLKFSGAENNTPQRRFIPAEGQNFKSDIEREVERIISDYKAENVDAKRLQDIDTSADLYRYLKEVLGDRSVNELRLAVMRTPDLLEAIEDAGLLELL